MQRCEEDTRNVLHQYPKQAALGANLMPLCHPVHALKPFEGHSPLRCKDLQGSVLPVGVRLELMRPVAFLNGFASFQSLRYLKPCCIGAKINKLSLIDHAVLIVLYTCYNMQQLLSNFSFVQMDAGLEFESLKKISAFLEYRCPGKASQVFSIVLTALPHI